MLLLPAPARGQPEPSAPRVGLVLSGGSAKGLAHVGVLKVLEREGIPVHVVAGTSMGSIVGGLYAMGLSVDSLEALVRGLDWDALFTDRVERDRLSPDQRAFDERTIVSVPLRDGRIALPSGVVHGTAILRLLDRLTWPVASVRDFREFPRPFVAVATDLESGEAVRLHRGVLSHALRASMSLPGVFTPFEVEGRLLVDGGVVRNLPAQDAEALGADVLLCSDVTDPLEDASGMVSALDVVVQAASFASHAATLEERGRCDVLIRPSLDGLSSAAFHHGDEWVSRGEAAAEEALGALAALGLAAVGGGGRLPGGPTPVPDVITLSAVTLDGGLGAEAAALVERVSGLAPGVGVTRDRMDAAVRDLYATGLFDLVRYRLDEEGGYGMLHLTVRKRAGDRAGLGFRYDTSRRAALLFTATLYNRIQYGSVARLDVRLGEDSQVAGTFLSGRGVTRRLSLGGWMGWSRVAFRIPAEGGGVLEERVDLVSVAGLGGMVVGRTGVVALEVTGEHARERDAPDTPGVERGTWSAWVSARLVRESFDRPDFPTAGGRLRAQSEVGVSSVGGGGSFVQHTVRGRRLFPLARGVSLDLTYQTGAATGAGLPRHRRYMLGGLYPSPVLEDTQWPLAGAGRQELRGAAAQLLRAGLQWEVTPGRFVAASVDAGAVSSSWRFLPEPATVGWALSVGAASRGGPALLTLSGDSGLRRARLSLGVGRSF